ncbi:MAG: DUF2066 domain-containing protein [Alphaproteobacteria bacterium]|nr:DUF2066 domain-containing protein [Alphaproteobacteria bacterium]
MQSNVSVPGFGGQKSVIKVLFARVTVILILGAAVPQIALAQSNSNNNRTLDELFTVSDIWVNETDSDPSQARDAAIADGEVRAFPILLRRLTLASDHARLPNLTPNDILAMVTGFEVDDERVSPMRYVARLTVSYNPLAVRTLLEANGLALAEASQRPILILPIIVAAQDSEMLNNLANTDNSSELDGKITWFDDSNPWRRAWLTARQKGVMQKWVVARADMASGTPNLSELSKKNQAIFRNAIIRGGFQGFTVVVLEVSPDATNFGVSLIQNGERRKLPPLTTEENQSYEDLLHRAVSLASQALDENWKRETLLEVHDRAEMAMLTNITSLEDWLRLQQIMADIPQIRVINTQEISLGQSVILLNFVGGLASLKTAFMQRGVDMFDLPEGMTLVPMERKAAPANTLPLNSPLNNTNSNAGNASNSAASGSKP